MLTVIAYQFIVAGSLPRVPYLTIMDQFILASLLAIAATMATNVIVDFVAAHHAERAARIDRYARWAFPAAYATAIGWLTLRTGIL